MTREKAENAEREINCMPGVRFGVITCDKDTMIRPTLYCQLTFVTSDTLRAIADILDQVSKEPA